MKKEKFINGVDVERMSGTAAAVREKKELARFTFRARNRWISGAHNQTFINEYSGAGDSFTRSAPFVLDKDEAPVLLGKDKGPNPVEYVLAALAGCLTTSLVYHAAARGLKVDAVESVYEGDLDLRGFLGMDDRVRNGYEKIRVKFKIEGDLTPAQKRELVELARERSPVFDIVSHPVDVAVDLEEPVPRNS